MNEKRKQQLIEYGKARIRFLIKNKYCAVKDGNHDERTVLATDIHHMRGRSGEKLLDQEDWLPVCRECHTYIEEHPAWARAKGYSRSRLEI